MLATLAVLACSGAVGRPELRAVARSELLRLRGGDGGRPLLVVGSLNMDVTLSVDRLPRKGETIMARSPCSTTSVGGKGANQAVAAARLGAGALVKFVGQFGNDGYARMLEATIVAEGVDVSDSGRSAHMPSGQGIVMLEGDGAVSSVVVGGSNTAWPAGDVARIAGLARGAAVVMLQREIPEEVNEAVVQAACEAGVCVLQDIGGEDRPLSDALLARVSFVCPNESELARLTGLPVGSAEEAAAAARALQARGAQHVLVTLGHDGSLLLCPNGSVLRQSPLPVPGGKVVDSTGAGQSPAPAALDSAAPRAHARSAALDADNDRAPAHAPPRRRRVSGRVCRRSVRGPPTGRLHAVRGRSGRHRRFAPGRRAVAANPRRGGGAGR